MWWITLSLILAGIIFMLVEMLLIPGVGIAGIFSLISLGAACWYSFDFISPSAGWWVTATVLLIMVVMITVILRSKTWKRFELNTEVTSKVNTDQQRLKVGDKGFAQTRLAPIGTGCFGNVTCEIKSADNSMISAGTEVDVTAIVDNQVLVKPVNK